jgi:hypothetical protein
VILLFPFLAWLAILTSAVTLVLLSTSGESGWKHGAAALVWLLAAGYWQFFGSSAVMSAIGLLLQTLLAIYLIVRWKLAG